jgi:hypothetical protein
MDPAALHPGADEHRVHGLPQAQVRIRDHQPHPCQAAGLQRAQERGQNAPASLSPTSTPSTSRRPVAVTPTATTTAWETT